MSISQKRRTTVLLILSLIGSVALGLLWWDSLENVTAFSNKHKSSHISIHTSSLHIPTNLYGEGNWSEGSFWRTSGSIYDLSNDVYFPKLEIAFGVISIPIYFILLGYLASLLVIWLVLMNRLARREFQKTD